ncbi:hypothetical protein, partial [Aeromonas enteropelogenes]
SRSFWRYWVSAIGKFIPKSGAECRINNQKFNLSKRINYPVIEILGGEVGNRLFYLWIFLVIISIEATQ